MAKGFDETKVPGLIEEVHRREILWKKTNDFYKKKGLKSTEWGCVAKALGVNNKEDCSCKWKSLVRRYQTEERKIKNAKSGSGAGQTESDWIYFKSMTFLRASVEQKKSTGNLDVYLDEKTKLEVTSSIDVSKSNKENDDYHGDYNSDPAYSEDDILYVTSLLPHFEKVPPSEVLNLESEINALLSKYAYPEERWLVDQKIKMNDMAAEVYSISSNEDDEDAEIYLISSDEGDADVEIYTISSDENEVPPEDDMSKQNNSSSKPEASTSADTDSEDWEFLRPDLDLSFLKNEPVSGSSDDSD